MGAKTKLSFEFLNLYGVFFIFSILLMFSTRFNQNYNSLVFCLSYVFQDVPHSVQFLAARESYCGKRYWQIVYFIHSRSPCITEGEGEGEGEGGEI